MSLASIEAGEHHRSSGRRHIRIEHIAPGSSAAAARAAGLLEEGCVVHQIDMLSVEVCARVFVHT